MKWNFFYSLCLISILFFTCNTALALNDYNKNVKRNGYFQVHSGYGFKSNLLSISSGFGVVIPGNFIEGSLLLQTTSLLNKDNFNFNVAFMPEINFIKNDGMNKIVPGVMVTLGYIHGENQNSVRNVFTVGCGGFLRLFVSENFAIIPLLAVGYAINTNALGVGVNLALRTYY